MTRSATTPAGTKPAELRGRTAGGPGPATRRDLLRTAQYRYVAVINFNRPPDAQQAYRGFGIFLHGKNGKGTAGCIGITAGQMKQVLRYLRPGDKITIRR